MRRLHSRARAVAPDEWYGVQPAWAADHEALPEARQQAHDLLLEQMGERRTGPVTFRTYEGRSAHSVLDVLATKYGHEGMAADVIRRLRAHLREYGGFLVVATAPEVGPR
jgi:hypothetical protein